VGIGFMIEDLIKLLINRFIGVMSG